MHSDLYTQAHLFVAAVRIVGHRKDAPPTLEDIADMLKVSLEQCHRLCRRLCEKGIIRHLESAYESALYIQDHNLIETLPKEEDASSLADELQRFQKNKPNFDDKIKEFKAQQAQKRQNLFADLKKEFKDKLDSNED